MIFARFRFATPVLAACLLFAAAHASFAGSHSYPPGKPAFTFDTPTDWTTEQKSDTPKTLVCTQKSNGNVGLLVLSVPKAYTAEEFKVFLPAMAKGQLEAQKLTDIDIKEADDDKIGGGMSVIFVVVSAKMGDTAMIYTLMGFTPVPGKSYVIEHIVPAAEYKEHMDELQTILASFKPVE